MVHTMSPKEEERDGMRGEGGILVVIAVGLWFGLVNHAYLSKPHLLNDPDVDPLRILYSSVSSLCFM